MASAGLQLTAINQGADLMPFENSLSVKIQFTTDRELTEKEKADILNDAQLIADDYVPDMLNSMAFAARFEIKQAPYIKAAIE